MVSHVKACLHEWRKLVVKVIVQLSYCTPIWMTFIVRPPNIFIVYCRRPPARHRVFYSCTSSQRMLLWNRDWFIFFGRRHYTAEYTRGSNIRYLQDLFLRLMFLRLINSYGRVILSIGSRIIFFNTREREFSFVQVYIHVYIYIQDIKNRYRYIPSEKSLRVSRYKKIS